MAYNYPVTYPQYFPQYQPISPVSAQNNAQNQQNGLIWVQGEAGAKSYLVAPNCTVQLWDSESQTIYLKSADASGMPSMRVLDYTIRESAQNAPILPVKGAGGDLPDYATKDDLKAVLTRIKGIQERIDSLESGKGVVKA